MHIFIEHGSYEFLNLGDWAMLQVCIARIKSLSPDARITVVCRSRQRLEAIFPGVTGVTVEERSSVLGQGALFGRAGGWLPRAERAFLVGLPKVSLAITSLKRKNRVNPFAACMQRVDLVVASGGGYLTDAFPYIVTNLTQTLQLGRSLGARTVLFSQGLGPLENPVLRSSVGRALRGAELLACREQIIGPGLARELGAQSHDVRVTGDDAVELAYNLHTDEPGAAIGVNLRLASYSEIDSSILTPLRDIIQAFASAQTANLLPIPISLYPKENDLCAAHEILGLGNSGVPPKGPETPEEVIREIAKCRLVVTGSYHAAVMALAQGIPAIGLVRSRYYKGKFEGLAAQFGVGCGVVSLDCEEWRDVLPRMMNDFWKRSAELRAPLLSAARLQAEAQRSAYREIIDRCRTHRGAQTSGF